MILFNFLVLDCRLSGHTLIVVIFGRSSFLGFSFVFVYWALILSFGLFTLYILFDKEISSFTISTLFVVLVKTKKQQRTHRIVQFPCAKK